jgi:P-type Mg2+ transporter
MEIKFADYAVGDTAAIFEKLKTSSSGLSEAEAKSRIKIFGQNELKNKKTSLAQIFFRQFSSPFFYLLAAAAGLSFFIGEKVDSLVILLFIAVNVFLGFFQEARAEKSIYLLRKYFIASVNILRNGLEKSISEKDLVPGDLVLLEAGKIVPADLRLLKCNDFLIDESILTGESVPVPKTFESLKNIPSEIFAAKNIAFAGTAVAAGKALGVVISTGNNSVLGQIAKGAAGNSHKSAYEKNLLKFSQIIMKIVVAAIFFIYVANFIFKGTENIFDFSIFSIALIVSIIPEALPVVVTFTLSEGAIKMAKDKVVVRRLSAVEDLGDIEILCTDKTGTLTENKLVLERIVALESEKCLTFGLLASSYMKEEIESGFNPFDEALYAKASIEVKESLKTFKRIGDISFDFNRLRNGALAEDIEGNKILIIRGAPEIILKDCSAIDGGISEARLQKELAAEGYLGNRILGVAYKKVSNNYVLSADEKDLTFMGFLVFKDPLKSSSREAIMMAQDLGVKIKILTGDSKEVAGAIAKEVGLIKDEKEVILGEKLDSLPSQEFLDKCEKFSVFARVAPLTKLNIIKALQSKFEVGFLGDGVNDAPALKTANVALVVQGATDVAREASDVVLLEKDLRVIINGIRKGRSIFSNINKYIKCALASNFGNFYSIAVISLFINFLPMLPMQILLGNLLSDFPLIAIATDYIDSEEMKKPKFFQINQAISLIILLALVSTAFDFIFFALFYKSQPAILQTLWFIESILTEIGLIFIVRTRHFFLRAGRPSLALLAFTFFDALLIISLPFWNFGQKYLHFAAPPVGSLLTVFLLVLIYLVISEIAKLTYFRLKRYNLN